MNDEEPFKIYVTPVKYVKTAWLVSQLVHCTSVVDRSGGKMNEHRNGSSDIILGVEFNGRLCCSKCCPTENTQAHINNSRI
jgi:hypothetical protein